MAKYPWIRVEPGRTIKGVDPTLLAGLNRIGQIYGEPVTVFSGYRSPSYSAQVGGYANDPHTRGEAVDATIGGKQIGQVVPLALFQKVGLESGNTPGFYNGKTDPAHVQIPGSGVNKALVSPVLDAPAAQPTDLVQIAAEAARRAGIDPSLFVAQIHQESGFNPSAASPAGALGIAQIVPHWHPDAPAASDPVGQLQWAATYMAGLVKKYGDYVPALSVYNSGKPTTYLDPGFAKGQTYNYVRSITGYAKANPVAGGAAAAPPASAPAASAPVSAPPVAVKAPTVTPAPVGDQSAALLAALNQQVRPLPVTPTPLPTSPLPVAPVAPTLAAALPRTSFVPQAPLQPAAPTMSEAPSFQLRLGALLKGQT